MAEFQYCVSNANYDDIGQMDGGCGDNYSSLAGVDACGMVGGMNNYQQGLNGLTPSYCNQSSDYVGPRMMYKATAIPAYAGLQYYPTSSNIVDNQVVQAKIVNAGGQVAMPANQARNQNEQQFMNMVKQAAQATGVDVEKFFISDKQLFTQPRSERFVGGVPVGTSAKSGF